MAGYEPRRRLSRAWSTTNPLRIPVHGKTICWTAFKVQSDSTNCTASQRISYHLVDIMAGTRGETGPGDATGFRHAAEAASSLQELHTLFSAAVKPFGMTSFAVGHLQGGKRPVTMFMTTWSQKFMELYAINAFMIDDPIVLRAIVNSEPFTWAEARVGPGFDNNRVLTAFKQEGYEEGFAIPIHGPGHARGVVALQAHRLNLTPANRSHAVDIGRACYRLARVLSDQITGAVKLSVREREALFLVAQGFEDAAIATALGITRTSAHVYVERAKRRLGATTRAHAVALALRAGLL